MEDLLRITGELADEGRFHRQQLIEWWDQPRLERARVLVIGAGALGNEILKNLALLGIGNVFVADLDRIELSNLARSVLFRDSDIGLMKAEVAARRAARLCPQMQVTPFVGNIVYDLGAGVFRWADVVICGLDNREARVAVNQVCRRVGRPWIDGAIEGLSGVVRTFLPDSGACYECTMSEVDWQMLEARRSCALLSREQMQTGHTPTTATTSSIVAGFQCQEMLKLIHGLPVAGGAGMVINGQINDVYPVAYPEREDCLAHETFGEIVELPQKSSEMTLGEILARAKTDLDPDATLEFSREILEQLECVQCDRRDPVFTSLGKVTENDARCETCGNIRFPRMMHGVGADRPDLLDKSPLEVGLPPYDIIIGRSASATRAYLVAGDHGEILRVSAGKRENG